MSGNTPIKGLTPISKACTDKATMGTMEKQTSISIIDIYKKQTCGFMIPEVFMEDIPQSAINIRSDIIAGLERGEHNNVCLMRCTQDILESEKGTMVNEMDNMSMGDNDRGEKVASQEEWMVGEQKKRTYKKKTLLQATRHISRLRGPGGGGAQLWRKWLQKGRKFIILKF
jgi:hypothetical protein